MNVARIRDTSALEPKNPVSAAVNAEFAGFLTTYATVHAASAIVIANRVDTWCNSRA
jgi:hypothetical protein